MQPQLFALVLSSANLRSPEREAPFMWSPDQSGCLPGSGPSFQKRSWREEFKNGFRTDRLSCHRFLANAFRLLPHGFAYNPVNLFRLQPPQPWRSAQIETLH